MSIPKIIHYCWFGRNPLPELAIKCIASWKKFLPDYEIKEWNEGNFNVNIIPYTAEAYKAKKYAFVSDYARIWILYHYGGLYFDTDVEVIKSIDDIIEVGPFMGCESYVNDPNGKGATTIGVAPGLGLGVNPGLGLLKKILESYEQSHFATWNGKYTGNIVGRVTKIIKEEGLKDIGNGILMSGKIYIYPPDYFCPLNYYSGILDITENTRSIHHYQASWVSANKTLASRFEKRFNLFFARLCCSINFLFQDE